MRAYWALALTLALGISERTQAQAPLQVAGRSQVQLKMTARLTIPDMLNLQVRPGQARAVKVGEYQAMDDAVTLVVSANRSWKLVVATATQDPALELNADAESARVMVQDGTADPGAQHEIAQGTNGSSMLIRLGYRWKGTSKTAPRPVYSLVAT